MCWEWEPTILSIGLIAMEIALFKRSIAGGTVAEDHRLDSQPDWA